jgi:DNA-binding Lrp family transcriptional regulator
MSDETSVFPISAPASANADAAAVGDGATVAPVPLDAVDVSLLRLLYADARMSQRRLGREIGMSAPAVADRLSRLERLGVIRGYRVDIDRVALGFPMVVYVGLVTVQGTDQRVVLERLRDLIEVEDVQIVTGPKDMLVRLRLRDHGHLRDVLFERIWNIPGVDRSECYISLGAMRQKAIDVALLDGLSQHMQSIGQRRPKES